MLTVCVCCHQLPPPCACCVCVLSSTPSSLPCYRQELISCAELEAVLAQLKETSGEAKVRSLVSVLDEDHDGNINIREVAQVRVYMPYLLSRLMMCVCVCVCVCAGDREPGTGGHRHSARTHRTHQTSDREGGAAGIHHLCGTLTSLPTATIL